MCFGPSAFSPQLLAQVASFHYRWNSKAGEAVETKIQFYPVEKNERLQKLLEEMRLKCSKPLYSIFVTLIVQNGE